MLETNPKALTLLIAAGNHFTKIGLDPLLKKLEIPEQVAMQLVRSEFYDLFEKMIEKYQLCCLNILS